MQSVEAILFDMDGVVTDSEPLHEKAFEIAYREVGLPLPEGALMAIKGTADREAVGILARYSACEEAVIEDIMERKRRIYHDLLDEVTPIPGAAGFIRAATERFRLAVVTSANRADQERALATLGLDDCFDVCVTAESVRNTKPHPEPYEKAAALIGVAAANCVVVEDSVNGIRSGLAAGCRVAGLTTTFPADRLEAAGATRVVASYEELAALLKLD